MAQARRIKPKKEKKEKKPKKVRKPLNLPWGLLSIILLSGVVIGVLFSGAQKEGTGFGSGLKELFSKEPPTEGSDEAIVALIEDKSVDKTFSFYDILPDGDQFMPEDLPESKPNNISNRDYFLQAASFINQTDAEKLRASLALKGYRSVTQARTSKGVLLYRVRLGPYADKRKAKTAKTKLQRIGVKPFMYSVEKK